MIDEGVPVTIDFDSCKREGDKSGVKIGTHGWTLDGEEYTRRGNDLYSLSKIQVAVIKDGRVSNSGVSLANHTEVHSDLPQILPSRFALLLCGVPPHCD